MQPATVTKAMIRLNDFSDQYPGLSLDKCGLLFLATPHSGTLAGNWNDYLLDLAKSIGKVGRGRDFTQLLSAFNNESRSAKELFGRLKPVPLFKCLHETQKMPIKVIERLIVSADSAGLNNETARGMPYADHSTICKFPNKYDQRYLQVLQCLSDIQRQLVERQQQQKNSLPRQKDQAQREQPIHSLQPEQQRPRPASEDSYPRTQTESRGGDATGGNAEGQSARGGDAIDGDADGSGAIGRNAVGGNAVSNAMGGNARGGNARGGNARGESGTGGDARGWDAGARLEDVLTREQLEVLNRLMRR